MNDILMYIIAIVIVAVIAGIIIFEMKGQKNGDKQVQDFLESIKDSLLKVIANQINTFNLGVLKDKDSLENFEKQFMESIYSSAINVTLEQLEAIKASHPITYSIIKKTITEDKIKDYINTLFFNEDVKTKIENLYNTALAAKMKKIEEDDKKLEAEQDVFDKGEDHSIEVPVAENVDPDRGEQKEEKIIPPSDAATRVVTDVDEEVSKEEYDKYNDIANKGLIDTEKRPAIKVIEKE